MSRRYCPPPRLVSELCALDLAQLAADCAKTGQSWGLLIWMRAGSPSASLRYQFEGQMLRLSYGDAASIGIPLRRGDDLIDLTTSRQHFGGLRAWFLCPLCRRRCRILYAVLSFRCRTCCGAKYQSQYESRMDRISGKRWKLRRRFRSNGAGLSEFPDRPAGMHLSTYHRLMRLDRSLAAQWTGNLALLEVSVARLLRRRRVAITKRISPKG